jgi:drug/metabolite transporter (DMT)-like permease
MMTNFGGSVQMTRGIALGGGAGLLWGLAFVLPGLAPQWTAVSVTTGRYLAYGVASLVVLALIARRQPEVLGMLRRHWRTAVTFAATGNVVYYLLLVVGIQGAGAPVASAIVGSVPVVMAVASNVREPVYTWRALALPLLMVGAGLATVSGPQLLSPVNGSPLSVIVGVVASVVAVGTWTTYGMSNATFLHQHPEVGGSAWSAIVGVFTGVLAIALVPIALLLGPTAGAGDINAHDIAALGAVGAVLGVVFSWGGTWLWNEASSRISTTLAGLLIVVETISGYTYSYFLKERLPPVIEVFGFALVVAGVVVVARLPLVSRERVFFTPA